MGQQFGEVALYKPGFVGIGGIQMGLWWFMMVCEMAVLMKQRGESLTIQEFCIL